MSDASRAAILDRLRSAPAERPAASPRSSSVASNRWTAEERLSRLRRMMEAVKTEFLEADRSTWPAVLRSFLSAQGVRTLLYAPQTDAGRQLETASAASELPRLVAYERPVEEWKEELFGSIDAAVTTTRGAIADTGSLIVWPSPAEPRLMSLVPPIHVALLDVRAIHETFGDVMREESWASRMPPNALLISGPSKTADIEQTLAYGVHGPKRLIVVVVGSILADSSLQEEKEFL